MDIDPAISLGLLAFAIAVTFGTNWLVARLWGQSLASAFSIPSLGASIVWIALTFVAGLIAARYIQRTVNTAAGYLLFGLVAVLLSVARAILYCRVLEDRKAKPKIDSKESLHRSMQNLDYLLFAAVLYLALSWLTSQPVELVMFIPLSVGALLPGLDSQDSLLGHLIPFASRWMEAKLGHRQQWHTLAAAALVALFTAPLILLIGLVAWSLVPLGFVSHLLVDMLAPEGVMLLWPASYKRYVVSNRFVRSSSNGAKYWLTAALAVGVAVLLMVVDIGRPPTDPAPPPSYAQTLDRAYALRGRYQIFVSVEGTWQVTGRRMSGRFEILNVVEESYIMLDRYTGQVFTAGHAGDDNLYLNRLTLQTGSSIRVKPVEVHLEAQRLGEALGIVYQMQNEPGVQYIYAFGDIVLPEGSSPGLQVDHAQTSLRRIQALQTRHYRIQYLTAAEVIELADLRVETADLVIVATYASPAAGPTATPLPELPPSITNSAPEEQP
jgi:membrane-bound metal-dependent hydrolase YbcI (DUF457 family)